MEARRIGIVGLQGESGGLSDGRGLRNTILR